jgi:membrane fusion protein, multidrug efflux system
VFKMGFLLVKIHPRPFEAEVSHLQAQLAQARASLQRSQNEARRGERLRASNAISAELADARSSAELEAKAMLASAQAQLQTAQLNLSFTQIRAPINGRVSRALITAGNLVNAGDSLLTTVVSTEQVYAYFDADERVFLKYNELARQGARGDSSPVYLGLSDEDGYPHLGHMNFIDNQVDPNTGTIHARAVFDNTQGIFTPGLYARLKLVGSATYDAVLIKDLAVGTDLGKKFVLVLDNDAKVSYRAVELGPKLAGLRIVRSGLKAGEQIVVNGLQHVRPGMAVQAQTVEMADANTLATLARERDELAASNAPRVALQNPVL